MNLWKFVVLLPALHLLIWGGISVDAVQTAWATVRSPSWPSANGTVVTSEWKRQYRKGCNVVLNLRYSYVVAGVSYVGTNYRFGGECNNAAEQIAASLPVGTQVQVHYKPGLPEQSVIAAGEMAEGTKVALVVALPATLFALLFIYILWPFRSESPFRRRGRRA